MDNFWFINEFYSFIIDNGLTAVAIVAFFESLIIGFIIPGTLLMAGFGVLIGQGELSFWLAWLVGSAACITGDWISYLVGFKLKEIRYLSNYARSNSRAFTKVRLSLHKYRFVTIFFGRFLGPLRPIVTIASGFMGVKKRHFVFPNLIACLLWPPFLFLPGIITGAAFELDENPRNEQFHFLVIVFLFQVMIVIWLFNKYVELYRKRTNDSRFSLYNLKAITITICILLPLTTYIIVQHPSWKNYISLIGEIIF